MLKQMFLPTCLVLYKFSVINFVIVPSKTEFISGFSYILFPTTLTGKEIDQTFVIAIKLMIYFKGFTCYTTRKCVSFFNI